MRNFILIAIIVSAIGFAGCKRSEEPFVEHGIGRNYIYFNPICETDTITSEDGTQD